MTLVSNQSAEIVIASKIVLKVDQYQEQTTIEFEVDLLDVLYKVKATVITEHTDFGYDVEGYLDIKTFIDGDEVETSLSYEAICNHVEVMLC